MKIKFHNTEQAQRAVRRSQEEIRKAKPRKFPILRFLFLFVVVVLCTYFFFQFQRLDNVYGYGIVSSNTESFEAPFQGVVNNLNVQRGNRVAKGRELFVIEPRLSEEERQAQQQILERLEELRESIRSAEDARRVHAIEMARIEVQKLTQFYESKRRRYEELRKLRRMEAVTTAAVETARNEMEIAQHNLDQAKLDLELAARGTEAEELLLDEARFKYDFATARQEPVSFNASFDGVVTQVGPVSGNFVNAGRTIVAVSSTQEIWVDAYLPPDETGQLAEGQVVDIYPPGRIEEPIRGVLADAVGTEVKTPSLLAERMPNEPTAILARIELPAGAELLPGGLVRVVIEGAGRGSAVADASENLLESIQEFLQPLIDYVS